MYWAVLLSVSILWPAQAQVASSSLLGTIADESSAAAPGVEVIARNESTGFSRKATTGPDGHYRIDDLLPGTYTVSAWKEGFRKSVARGVFLEVNQKGKLDFQLRVGEQRDSVTVTARISLVQANDASVAYRLGYPTIRGLPLEVRDVVSLVTLGPGAIPRQLGGFVHDVVNDVQEGRGAVALNPPINGSRSTMNTFLLDGALNTDLNTRAIVVKPPLESVQEFRIQSSLPSAEFAQSGGGVADLVTKTGTLDFHGNAFEFFRNEAVDARNFFDDPGLPRPIFRQNQFGGSLGGPLPLPSTFFFASYEGLRGKSAKSALQIVPPQALRTGDFQGQAPLFDPLSLDPVTGKRRPFPNNVIPSERLDPAAAAFLDQFEPLPNRASGASNYLDSTPGDNTDDSLSTRVDHQLLAGSRLFVRYTLNEERNHLSGNFPELPTTERIRAQQAALGHTYAGARWLNEARFSYTRLRVFELPESAFQRDVAKELGISGPATDPANWGLPFFLVTNFSMVTDTPNRPLTQRDNLWHFSDGVSLVRGPHTWKLGFEYTRFQLNYLQSRLSRGQYIFTGAFTSDAGVPGATGDPFADFLLGFPQFTNRNVGDAQSYLRQNVYAGYAQDDWRVNTSLTLNFGVRYEYASPYTEARGNLVNLQYSPAGASPQLNRVESAVTPDRNNWSPRVGLAWKLPASRWTGSQTVFRAGYGVYFNPEIAVETYDLVRNGIRNESNVSDGAKLPVLTLRDGFPQTASTGFPSYFGLDPKARTPYVQQWTASVQRELPGKVVAEIAYIGTKGTKLGRFRTLNTPLHVVTGENLAPRPGDLQSLRPYPELGKIIQRQHIANSIYHALEIKAEKRMSSRLAFLGSFVWSKSIDDADSPVPGQYDSAAAQDERNLRLERGLSFFNVGRRVSAGFVYALPSGDFFKPVFGNWHLSGILTLQDGTPVNPIYFAFDGANSGTVNRPDIVPGQKITLPRSQRSADRFFNTDAFRQPAPFTFGNAGRNIIAGPGNNIFDMAVYKRFPVRDAGAIEFRMEFFNLFNHPNFGIPGPYPDFGPFFGKIFSTGQPRRVQFGLRFDF
jgi:hypothetical protein